jgi:uncharacterized membrane protein (UPF0182 family)
LQHWHLWSEQNLWNHPAVFLQPVAWHIEAIRLEKFLESSCRLLCRIPTFCLERQIQQRQSEVSLFISMKNKTQKTIRGHPRSNADPQLGYGKLIPVQSPKQPLASPCQSFFQFFTTFTTKMNQNLTAFDSFLEVHCFHRNMLSHLSQTSAATITISWTFQILKKISELRSWLCFGRKPWIMDANAEIYWIYWKWAIWTHRRPKKRQGFPERNKCTYNHVQPI